MDQSLTPRLTTLVNPHLVAPLEGAQSTPHRAVALEATAKRNLPHAVPAADALLGLNVGEDVPDGGGGGVAVPEKGILGGLGQLGTKGQLLLDLVNHATPAWEGKTAPRE